MAKKSHCRKMKCHINPCGRYKIYFQVGDGTSYRYVDQFNRMRDLMLGYFRRRKEATAYDMRHGQAEVACVWKPPGKPWKIEMNETEITSEQNLKQEGANA